MKKLLLISLAAILLGLPVCAEDTADTASNWLDTPVYAEAASVNATVELQTPTIEIIADADLPDFVAQLF